MSLSDPLERALPTVGFDDLTDKATRFAPIDLSRCTGEHPAPWECAFWATSISILYGLARHACLGREHPVLVEIGVQHGRSTGILLRVAEEMDGTLISMDPEPGADVADRLRILGLDMSRWTLHKDKSQNVPPVESDFLFVDGDHGYAATCSDMARHGVAVRAGGVIVLDDVHLKWPGKTQWLFERWHALHPLTIGPFGIIQKRNAFNDVFMGQFVEIPPPGPLKWTLKMTQWD